MPHIEQWLGSVSRFTQPAPGQQIANGPVHAAPPGASGQEHAPALHTSPEPQRSQLGPQLRASLRVSEHVDSPQQVASGVPGHTVIAEGQ